MSSDTENDVPQYHCYLKKMDRPKYRVVLYDDTGRGLKLDGSRLKDGETRLNHPTVATLEEAIAIKDKFLSLVPNGAADIQSSDGSTETYVDEERLRVYRKEQRHDEERAVNAWKDLPWWKRINTFRPQCIYYEER